LGRKDTVYHLQRTLYGWKQAPRAWYHKLQGVLEEMGFKQFSADPGLFTKDEGKDVVTCWSM
jgi:histone deacetylase 1/2